MTVLFENFFSELDYDTKQPVIITQFFDNKNEKKRLYEFMFEVFGKPACYVINENESNSYYFGKPDCVILGNHKYLI
jgi:hypothetical protein